MNYDAMTDEDLLSLYYQGDDVAFQHLAGRHDSRARPESVRNIACHLVRGNPNAPALVDELVQQTFFRVMRTRRQNRGRWQPGRSSVRAWMGRIAANLFRDMVRNRRVRPVVVPNLPDVPIDAPDLLERLVAEEQRALLLACIAELPEERARPFALRMAGSGYEKIAAELGISLATAHRRVAAAVAQLRECVRANGGAE